MLEGVEHLKLERKNFEKIEQEYQVFEEKREKIIRKSRDVVRSSKKVIYAIHRGESPEAFEGMMREFEELMELSDPKTSHIGAFRVAVQEVVEAYCFREMVKTKRLPDRDSIGNIDYELYLLGIADLVGELGRLAVNSATNEHYGLTREIKEFVSELYSLFSEYDFRNSELRRKYDGMKYELKKLEELVFELKMKGHI